MTRITRRAFSALAFAGVAAEARAKAPAVKSAWPDAIETAAMIRTGQMSALEAAKGAVDGALKLQPRLNFLVASDFDRALERGQVAAMTGPFAGVPFLIKDLNDYKGLPTRSGSRAMLAMPPATRQPLLSDAYDRAGVNVIGKSSTPEHGFLPTTEPTGFGPTRNPWDLARS
uniref:amidase family protein n=1 Tax=Phenylobacterium sp. TaxID=1871053 RepID=UPI00286D6F5A